MFCRSCGKEIPDLSPKCPVCGASQTITELEYRTGSKSRAGAALRRFREEPLSRQISVILEMLGILLGLAGILFGILYPDADLEMGARALLVLFGGTLILGFGIALCVTSAKCRKPEV